MLQMAQNRGWQEKKNEKKYFKSVFDKLAEIHKEREIG
jgi:hypothetical protein